MKTFARRDGSGDDAGWVLDGAKRWIGLASVAGVLVVWAMTDDGVRGFLVPAGTPGVTATPIGQKLSMRASIQCDITFDGVRLGPEALLPAARGLRGPFSCLNEARYGIAWGAMGAARDSYEAALAYSQERLQFGKPLAGYQLTQEKLVNMVLEIQKGTLLALHLGRLKDAGRLRPEQISLGKLNNVREALEHRPGGPHHSGRQRHHPGLFPAAARRQPGIRPHLRGHRRGAHPGPGPAHHGAPRVPLRPGRRVSNSGGSGGRFRAGSGGEAAVGLDQLPGHPAALGREQERDRRRPRPPGCPAGRRGAAGPVRSRSVPSIQPVSTGPGFRTLALMPSGPSSRAAAITIRSSAPLDAP